MVVVSRRQMPLVSASIWRQMSVIGAWRQNCFARSITPRAMPFNLALVYQVSPMILEMLKRPTSCREGYRTAVSGNNHFVLYCHHKYMCVPNFNGTNARGKNAQNISHQTYFYEFIWKGHTSKTRWYIWTKQSSLNDIEGKGGRRLGAPHAPVPLRLPPKSKMVHTANKIDYHWLEKKYVQWFLRY